MKHFRLLTVFIIILTLSSPCYSIGFGRNKNTKKVLEKLGDWQYWEEYVSKKKIDEENEYGRTILTTAVHNGEYNLVKACLDDGANPDIKTSYGYAALTDAIKLYLENGNQKYLDIILLLIERNTSPKTDQYDSLKIVFSELYEARNERYLNIDLIKRCDNIFEYLIPYCKSKEFFSSGKESYLTALTINNKIDTYINKKEDIEYVQIEIYKIISALLSNGYRLSLDDLNYCLQEGYLNPKEKNKDFFYLIIRNYFIQDDYKNYFINDKFQTLLSSIYSGGTCIEQRIKCIKFLTENEYVVAYSYKGEDGKIYSYTPMQLVIGYAFEFGKQKQSLKDFILWCHEKGVNINQLGRNDGKTTLDCLFETIIDELWMINTGSANSEFYDSLISIIEAYNAIVSCGYTEVKGSGKSYSSVNEFNAKIMNYPEIKNRLQKKGIVLINK